MLNEGRAERRTHVERLGGAVSPNVSPSGRPVIRGSRLTKPRSPCINNAQQMGSKQKLVFRFVQLDAERPMRNRIPVSIHSANEQGLKPLPFRLRLTGVTVAHGSGVGMKRRFHKRRAEVLGFETTSLSNRVLHSNQSSPNSVRQIAN
jgi:hypothetical protein